MTTLCKLFRLFCIVLSVCFLSVSPANAAGSLFTVENIKIDVTAENALAAREKAFNEAQAKAFNVLAERMLSASELQNFPMPQGLGLSTLIKDYEVSNEKLSAKRYSATYKFRFKSDAVRSHFAQSGASYTDVARKPLLILPFIELAQGGTALWSPSNAWMQAWNNTENLGGLVPLVVPIGDLMDVSDIEDDEALTYDPRRLRSMLRRYNASEAVIALAKPDPRGGVEVQIYRTDRNRPEYVHQVLQPSLGGASNEDAVYRAAVEQVRAALRDDWKKKTVIARNEGGYDSGQILVRVRFGSLQEWTKLRRNIERVEAVRGIGLDALSSREAYLTVSFIGGLARLKLALSQADMSLNDGVREANGDVIYDLAYGHYGETGRGASAGGAARAVDEYSARF